MRKSVLRGLILLAGLSLSCNSEELPKVLLIGDSISIGYLPYVKELLGGQALVDRIPLQSNGKPENCQGTTNGVIKIDRWLGNTHWDLIHFNFGLHDIKHVKQSTGENSDDPNDPPQADLQQYKKNLEEIVHKLKETGAKLIFATTTPYPEGTKPYRRFNDEIKYNSVAKGIMETNGIEINDLHAFVTPIMEELQRPTNVHFTKYGNGKLGEQVARSISKNLK